MAIFSERHSYTEKRTVVQREELDQDTRVALWNLFYVYNEMIDNSGSNDSDPANLLARVLWADLLKNPIDDYHSVWRTWGELKESVLNGEWYEVFNLAEYLLGAKPMARFSSELARTLNNELESKLTAYRIIDGKVVPVDSMVEVESLADALDASKSSPLAGVRHHLTNSIALLSDRAKPDHANSVKESISAVEAICELVTGNGVLSKALPKLKDFGIALHPAQVDAWKKMYGWTSDEGGVRHSAATVPDVDQATAKYMLVTCSAFVSLLIEEARKASVKGF